MYYATHHSRDFVNEFEIRAFATEAERDAYVASIPKSTWCEGYQAYVTANPSARAYPKSAGWVTKATYRDRKEGLDCEGRMPVLPDGRRMLTLAEYFQPQLDGTETDSNGYTPAEVAQLEADYQAGLLCTIPGD